ncbi:MAG: thiamine phosphate synthase [Candidatus Methylomirabilis sp.]|nr:thiamine phosphate synthase [Deltaproteobacteria bacterium]
MGKLPSVYLITDRKTAPPGAFLSTLKAALSGGIRLLQLREKDLSARELLHLAKEVRELASGYGAKLLINDRVDIAMLSGADGVHLTSNSYAASCARELLGPGKLIGVSTHSLDEARKAEAKGADFVTFGPVFHTPSKAKYGQPLGTVALKDTAAALSIPVYALGGVNKENLREAVGGGARIAVISAIMGSKDAALAARELIEKALACRQTE